MSRKSKDIDLGEFNLDDELDFDLDFDPMGMDIPEDRNPISVIPKAVADGAMNAFIGPGKRRQLIKKSLPENYQSAYETYDSIASEGRKIAQTAREELRTTKREIKRAGRDILPVVKNFMPKKLYDRLYDATKEYTFSDYDPRQAEMEAASANIFDNPERQAPKLDRQTADAVMQQKAEGEVKDQIRDIRLKQITNLLANIGQDSNELVGYQRTVTTDYRKKILELQHRQFFALTDLLEVTKTSNEKIVPSLESIVKNTALPDYAKEEFGEITGALMKRKVAEFISPTNFFKDYIEKTGENIRNRIKEVFSGVRMGISGLGTMASMANQENADLSPSQQRAKAARTGGEFAGEWLFDKFAGKYVKKGQDWIRGQLEQDNPFANGARRLAYNVMNAPAIANKYAKNPYYDGANSGVFGKFAEATQMLGILPTYYGPSASIDGSGPGDDSKAAAWNNRNSITLNEVIPGWLAKINQSIRLGAGLSAPLEQYDYGTKSFINTKEINDHIRKTVNDEGTREWMRKSQSELVDKLDPDGNLGAPERKALQDMLERQIRRGEDFDISELGTSFDAYRDVGWGVDISKLMSHFDQINADPLKSGKLNIDVAARLNQMRSEMSSVQENIDRMRERFGSTSLVNANVFKRDGLDLLQNENLFDHNKDLTEAPDLTRNGKPYIKRVLSALLGSNFNPDDLPKPDISDVLNQQSGLSEELIANGVRKALYANGQGDLASILKEAKGASNSTDRESTLEPIVNKIYEQLKANNLKPEIETILLWLEDLALHGIKTSPNDQGGPDDPGDPDADSGFFGRFGGMIKRAGRGLGRNALRFGSSAKSSIKRNAKRSFDLLRRMNPLRLVTETASSLMNIGKGFVKGALGDFDIYDGEGNIVLIGKWIKEGRYFNADGEVIKKISDIKGAIYDADGNILISWEELKAKLPQLQYFTSTGWKRLTEEFGSLLGRATTLPGKVANFAISRITKRIKSVYRHLTTGGDVYVEGETEPRLRRQLMMSGFYISQKTGKPIRSVEDIDGPVITKHNEMVISEAELANPKFKLVDVTGKPITAGLRAIKSVAKFGWDLARKGVQIPLNVMRYAGGKLADFAGAGLEWLGEVGHGGIHIGGGAKFNKKNEVVKKLTDIYNLLDDRIPDNNRDRKERQTDGDSDGDGERDNSFRAILKRRRDARLAKKAEKEKEKEGEPKEKSKGIFGMLLGGLMTVGKKIFTIGGELLAKVFTSTIGKTIGTVFDKALMPIFSKGAELLGKAMNFMGLGKAAAALGRGATAIASGLGTAAVATAKFVGTRMLMPVASWAASIGVAAIGAVTAPVAIGAGIIIGAGALAYGAYKLLSSKDNTQLDQVRFAFYGSEDYEDAKSDDTAKLRYFEAEFAKYTSFDNEGVAALKGMSAEEIQRIATGAGIQLNDPDTQKKFERWMIGRFIPVYLLWTTRFNQTLKDGYKTLLSGDDSKINPKQKLEILKGVMLPEDHPIFNVDLGPLEEEELLDGEDVLDVYNDIREDVEELVSLIPSKEEAAKIKQIGGSAYLANDFGKTNGMTNLMTGQVPKVATPGPKQTIIDTMTPSANIGPNSLDQAPNLLVRSGKTEKGRHVTNIVSAIDAVRLKTYGFTEAKMTTESVKLAYDLEDFVYKNITKANKEYIYSGKIEEIVSTFGGRFGYKHAKDSSEPGFFEFEKWIAERFLPVLLNFINVTNNFLPNANPFDIVVTSATPNLWDIAVATLGTISPSTKTLVWTLTYRPFADMTAPNNDQSTCDGQMDYLLRLRKETELKQQGKLTTGSINIKDDTKREIDVTKKWDGKTGGPHTALGDKIMGGGSGGGSTPGGNAPDGAPQDIDYGGYGNSPLMEGAGGSYMDIRAKDKSRASMVDVITRVAKIVGVDPALLLTIGMVESSLKPEAGAGSSSAKGLFQFIDGTWSLMLKKYANKYGIPSNASPYDPVANALLGAEYIREGVDTVSKVVKGRQVNAADIYMSHFMGPQGATDFIKGLQSNPNAIAANTFPGPAKANRSIFAEDKGTGPWRTYAGVYNEIQRRVRAQASNVSNIAGIDLNASNATTPPAGKVDAPTESSSSVGVNSVLAQQNASTAKAATDAKGAVHASAANESVNPNTTNAPANDKPYVAAAASAASSGVTPPTATADSVKNQIEIEKAKSAAKSDTVVRSAAELQLSGTESTLQVLQGQYKLQSTMVEILSEISRKISTTTPLVANSSQPVSNMANNFSPQGKAPEVQHGTAPVSVKRMSS